MFKGFSMADRLDSKELCPLARHLRCWLLFLRFWICRLGNPGRRGVAEEIHHPPALNGRRSHSYHEMSRFHCTKNNKNKHTCGVILNKKNTTRPSQADRQLRFGHLLRWKHLKRFKSKANSKVKWLKLLKTLWSFFIFSNSWLSAWLEPSSDSFFVLHRTYRPNEGFCPNPDLPQPMNSCPKHVSSTLCTFEPSNETLRNSAITAFWTFFPFFSAPLQPLCTSLGRLLLGSEDGATNGELEMFFFDSAADETSEKNEAWREMAGIYWFSWSFCWFSFWIIVFLSFLKFSWVFLEVFLKVPLLSFASRGPSLLWIFALGLQQIAASLRSRMVISDIPEAPMEDTHRDLECWSADEIHHSQLLVDA